MQKGCQFGHCDLNVCVTHLNINDIKDSDLAFKELYLKSRAFKAKYFHVQMYEEEYCWLAILENEAVAITMFTCSSKKLNNGLPHTVM